LPTVTFTDAYTLKVGSEASTKVGVGVDPRDMTNPWAVFGNYIDRVVTQCVNDLTPNWSGKLAAFDVFIRDQCYAMEQSLRID
jgi:hypothetical protein